MRYEHTAILFREGEDDFTLWAVDLPEDIVRSLKRSDCAILGEVDTLMCQMPIEEGNPENRLHILEKSCERYSLYTACVQWDFFEKYSGDGVSSRGSKEAIFAEIKELFQLQIKAPELTM